MRKRILALVLCLALLVCGVPVTSAAETLSEPERLMQQSVRTYRRALYSSGKSSLGGYCGLMTGLQLWALGCTKGQEIYNGNGYFDAYSQKEFTSAGYRVKCYGADMYSLEEALMTVTNGGTENAYNMIACFQWTNTRAGGRYGHAVVIHGIVDGLVYFVEGYYMFGKPEGNALVCTIAEFEDYFDDWTSYEGLVLLGQKEDAQIAGRYATDLFITGKDGVITAGMGGEAAVRSPADSEVLHATGIFEDPYGNRYYRVDEGYIPLENTSVQRVNTENASATAELPKKIDAGQDFKVDLKVLGVNSNLGWVQVEILDAAGSVLQSYNTSAAGHFREIHNLNIQALPRGEYCLRVQVLTENVVPLADELQVRQDKAVALELPFGVGQKAVAASAETAEDGWVYKDGVRYFYQDGEPRVGWYCDKGADYYFKEDGSVTTGWAEINGRWRCFTDTGVMRTGWVETSKGTCYMLSNGVAALGKREIDGIVYDFGDDGIMR